MMPIVWMSVAAVASWAAVAAFSEGTLATDVGFGLLGPLVSAIGTWLVIVRAARSNASQLSPVMLQAFFVKVLFFGAYIVVMLRVLSLTPVPFIVSFTAAFILLHFTEAVLLSRLTARLAASGASR